MKIELNVKKTPLQRQEIRELLEECRKAEPITLSFPDGEEDHVCLLHEEECLVGILSYTFPGDGTCECVMFTRPSKRRMGYADKLMDAFCEFLDHYEAENGAVLLTLLTDHRSPGAMRCLKIWDTRWERSEYMMERPRASDAPQPLSGDETLENPEEGLWRYGRDGQILASCRLNRQDSRFYLYQMEVPEDLRGKGHGTRFLELLLPTLPLPVRLQVSSENLPAMALYRKTGFQVTETLSFYSL